MLYYYIFQSYAIYVACHASGTTTVSCQLYEINLRHFGKSC